jgi:16S rRNA (cytidine1402-2'-O)-methyltransferase
VKKGTLYLIPNVIAEETAHDVIPSSVKSVLQSLTSFLVEDVRTARRYLSSLKIYDRIENLEFQVLNKDTQPEDLTELMRPLMEGKSMGVISDSGCPGIADPGALAVAYAHTREIPVVPLVGPSSLLLALMASGMNGQHFAFHGYLPIERSEAIQAIHQLEKESRLKDQTQIFIETPYRNNPVFSLLVQSLQSQTRLCVAIDLTGKSQQIISRTVSDWKRQQYDLPKLPAVFLFHSAR